MVEPCQPWLSNLAMTLQRVCVWPGHTWLWLRTVAGLYGPDIFTIYTTGAGQRQEKRRKTKSPLCVKTLIFPLSKITTEAKEWGYDFSDWRPRARSLLCAGIYDGFAARRLSGLRAGRKRKRLGGNNTPNVNQLALNYRPATSEPLSETLPRRAGYALRCRKECFLLAWAQHTCIKTQAAIAPDWV